MSAALTPASADSALPDGRNQAGQPAAGQDPGMTAPPGPVVIDGGSRACIALLLELRARISGLPAGTVIHLIASDPAAPIDLPAWCHLTGHTYLGRISTAIPTYALRTADAPVSTDPALPWRPGPHGHRRAR